MFDEMKLNEMEDIQNSTKVHGDTENASYKFSIL